MKQIKNQLLLDERALFFGRDLNITDCTFDKGESPLKHSSNVTLSHCTFRWKYPLWYSQGAVLDNCNFAETARSGVWYTHDITMRNCTIDAPKTFRRASKIVLTNVSMPNAAETLWSCRDVTLKDVYTRGDYFGMNTENVTVTNLTLDGNYGFDGAQNVTICDSRLDTKDAFWNCKNVTVRNSVIVGEYLGWNSRNLTFENCTITSLQGLCYVDNLVLKNCRLVNTTLALEYSTVDADIDGSVDSIFNPSGGRICADYIGELTIDKDRVDPKKTVVVCRGNKEEKTQ